MLAGMGAKEVIDFHHILTEFPCRLDGGDCGVSCDVPFKCCGLRPQVPLLPGEGAFLADNGLLVGFHRQLEVDVYPCPGREKCPGELRPISCKSFPLAPGLACLTVSQVCPRHGSLSPTFINEVRGLWLYVLSNSRDAAAWVAKVTDWAWSKENRIPLWRVNLCS